MRQSAIAVAFMLLFQSSFGWAKAPLCGDIFLDRASNRIALQSLLREHYEVDPTSRLQSLIVRYAAYRLQFNKNSDPRVVDNSAILVDRLMRMSERIKESGRRAISPEQRWMDRAVFQRSLTSLMLDFGYQPNQSVSALKKIFRHPAVKFLISPTDLPSVRDAVLPEGFLDAIIKDGVEAHRATLESYYRSKQMHVDHYRQVARVYKVIALAVFAALAYENIQSTQEDINEMKKQNLNQTLDGLDDLLSALDAELSARGL